MNPRPGFWIDLFTAFVAGAFLCSLMFQKAEAAELLIHGPSFHFDRDADYSNRNYGLGYAFDNNVVVGAYENSINRTSVYVGYLVNLNQHVGILAGVVTGYEERPVQPAVLLVLTAPLTQNWNAHLNVAPVKGGFINLSIGYQWGAT